MLRVYRKAPEFLTFNCVRCGWRGYACLTGPAYPRPVTPTVHAASHDDGALTARAREIWGSARSPIGTIVETYLAARGLQLPEDVVAADTVRFHPACPFGKERRPAMVAQLRDIRTNEPRAIHRTALKQDGSGKAGLLDGGPARRMLGKARGCAVKLIAGEEVTLGLGIAEGVETALAVICAGWHPVWACGSASAVQSFPVLCGVESLTIFADADQAGYRAARQCARSWSAAGREWRIVRPPRDGDDWNDVVGRPS